MKKTIMKKTIITVICIFIGLLIVYVLTHDARQVVYIEKTVNNLQDHIPSLKEYVITHNELLNEIVSIQTKLDEKHFSITNKSIRVYSFDDNGTHIYEDAIIADSAFLSSDEKVLIDTFISSFPEYGYLHIYPDEVSMRYRSSKNKDCYLYLSNVNRFDNGRIDNGIKDSYVEKIDETWYAVVIYTPLGMP